MHCTHYHMRQLCLTWQNSLNCVHDSFLCVLMSYKTNLIRDPYYLARDQLFYHAKDFSLLKFPSIQCWLGLHNYYKNVCTHLKSFLLVNPNVIVTKFKNVDHVDKFDNRVKCWLMSSARTCHVVSVKGWSKSTLDSDMAIWRCSKPNQKWRKSKFHFHLSIQSDR